METIVLVNGSAGRMGRAVLAAAAAEASVKKTLSLDIGNAGSADILLAEAGVAVDFSSPAGAVSLLKKAEKARKPVVVGTTGFSKEQMEEIRKISSSIPVFLSPNMSPAVNLTFALAKIMAGRLNFDIHIHETHHTAKKDAPSGTALKYLEFIEAAGKKATVTSARIGDITGEHVLTFAGKGEKITLTHTASSRDIFAAGALKAALWLVTQKAGFYDFFDFFGMKI